MIYKTLHRKLMIEQHKAKHIYNALRPRFQAIMYDIFILKEQMTRYRCHHGQLDL